MMEVNAENFYLNAVTQSTDTAKALSKGHLHTSVALQEESRQKRQFILIWV